MFWGVVVKLMRSQLLLQSHPSKTSGLEGLAVFLRKPLFLWSGNFWRFWPRTVSWCGIKTRPKGSESWELTPETWVIGVMVCWNLVALSVFPSSPSGWMIVGWPLSDVRFPTSTYHHLEIHNSTGCQVLEVLNQSADLASKGLAAILLKIPSWRFKVETLRIHLDH